MIEKILHNRKYCNKCGRRLYSNRSQEEEICAFCHRKSRSKGIGRSVKIVSSRN